MYLCFYHLPGTQDTGRVRAAMWAGDWTGQCPLTAPDRGSQASVREATPAAQATMMERQAHPVQLPPPWLGQLHSMAPSSLTPKAPCPLPMSSRELALQVPSMCQWLCFEGSTDKVEMRGGQAGRRQGPMPVSTARDSGGAPGRWLCTAGAGLCEGSRQGGSAPRLRDEDFRGRDGGKSSWEPRL